MQYRNLKKEEIDILSRKGCSAEDWDKIFVKEGFNPGNYRNATFIGEVYLGNTEEGHLTTTGYKINSGIYDAVIHNCSIGDNVYISRIGEHLSNYHVGDNSFISNAASISANASSAFGNGTKVSVMNENGGRVVTIYENISSQIAYILALYRHDSRLVNALEALIDRNVTEHRIGHGTIENDVRIANCGIIANVNFRSKSVAEGISKLSNGTIGIEAYAGVGVIAENFIFMSQSRVDSGSKLHNVLVGQNSSIANGFIAHDSLFFANNTLECGEACAVFAGPHTVSMHKSTLLIGGMFSFFNAGSATNESNHLYKTGPVHQGIMRRGCKTGSGTYIKWPASFGMFNFVAGKHYSHPDTSLLPFSYVLERDGKTLVLPGNSIRNIGTTRDILKWETRDTRKPEYGNLDIINNDIASPYFLENIINGLDFLKNCDKNPDYCADYNITIDEAWIERGKNLYKVAEQTVLVTALLDMILTHYSHPVDHPDMSHWIDASGMLVPQSRMDDLVEKIINNDIKSVEELHSAIMEINAEYTDMKFSYMAHRLEKNFGIRYSSLSANDSIRILRKFIDSLLLLAKEFYNDAQKEFSGSSMISYGIDGDMTVREQDFIAVRGSYSTDKVVSNIRKHYSGIIEKAHQVIHMLKKTIADNNNS